MKSCIEQEMQRRTELTGLHENSFDYFRLFAAVQVLLGHIVLMWNVELPKVASTILEMFAGVPILFTLCGFLVTASYLKSKDIKEYYKKRLFRIFPPLWISVLVGVVVVFVFYGKEIPFGTMAVWAIAQGGALQYTPIFLRGFGSGSFNGALWALFTEIQFYVSLPFFIRFMRGKTMRVWMFFGVVLLLLNITGNNIVAGYGNRYIYLLWNRFLFSSVMYFYIGCFVCSFYDRIVPVLKKYFPVLLALYVCLYIVRSKMGGGGSFIGFYPIVCSLLL